MTREIERRNTGGLVELVEIREGKNAPMLTGYAAKWMRNSQNLGGFVERVAPGAFTKSLKDGGRMIARFNHDDNQLLGTTDAQTLRVSTDDDGLPYEVDLPDTNAGRDLAVLAKRGDVRYSSFAFRTLDDEWGVTEDGFPLRTLLEAQLIDVAPVVNPAYMDTTTGMRSLAARLDLALDEVRAKAVDTAGLVEIRGLLLAPHNSPMTGAPRETHGSVSRQRARLRLSSHVV